MIDPELITTVGLGISGLTSVVLLYLKNNNALNLKKLDNKVVSENLFTTELAKRDTAIAQLQAQIQDLMSKYSDQRQRDLEEIESWKDKYNEQVEINEKLQSDFENLKATITDSAMQAHALINDKVEEIKNI